MAMKNLLQQFVRDETGATAIEYGLIVTVLSLTIIGGVGKAADALQW
ncbi:MAG: Flp family type IVb pilin, partial [Mesorhizobium sp.]